MIAVEVTVMHTAGQQVAITIIPSHKDVTPLEEAVWDRIQVALDTACEAIRAVAVSEGLPAQELVDASELKAMVRAKIAGLRQFHIRQEK